MVEDLLAPSFILDQTGLAQNRQMPRGGRSTASGHFRQFTRANRSIPQCVHNRHPPGVAECLEYFRLTFEIITGWSVLGLHGGSRVVVSSCHEGVSDHLPPSNNPTINLLANITIVFSSKIITPSNIGSPHACQAQVTCPKSLSMASTPDAKKNTWLRLAVNELLEALTYSGWENELSTFTTVSRSFC